jgi:excisionase family DNA binding protein
VDQGPSVVCQHSGGPPLFWRPHHNNANDENHANDATEKHDSTRIRPSVRVVQGEEELIGSGEVARRLGVTTRAIGRWVERGMLTPAVVTPGGRYRFRWHDVERQLRELRQRPADDE